jgi:hypothetical protein
MYSVLILFRGIENQEIKQEELIGKKGQTRRARAARDAKQ